MASDFSYLLSLCPKIELEVWQCDEKSNFWHFWPQRTSKSRQLLFFTDENYGRNDSIYNEECPHWVQNVFARCLDGFSVAGWPCTKGCTFGYCTSWKWRPKAWMRPKGNRYAMYIRVSMGIHGPKGRHLLFLFHSVMYQSTGVSPSSIYINRIRMSVSLSVCLSVCE